VLLAARCKGTGDAPDRLRASPPPCAFTAGRAPPAAAAACVASIRQHHQTESELRVLKRWLTMNKLCTGCAFCSPLRVYTMRANASSARSNIHSSCLLQLTTELLLLLLVCSNVAADAIYVSHSPHEDLRVLHKASDYVVAELIAVAASHIVASSCIWREAQSAAVGNLAAPFRLLQEEVATVCAIRELAAVGGSEHKVVSRVFVLQVFLVHCPRALWGSAARSEGCT
jgi:hypothetical protein